MANYILGVDQPSKSYKLYKADTTLPTANFTKVATLSGLKDSLIGAEDTNPIDPSTKGIKVTPAAGETTTTYTVTIGKNALSDNPGTNTSAVSATAAEGKTVTLARGGDVTAAATTYEAKAVQGTEGAASQITITPEYAAGWYLKDNKLMYSNGNVETGDQVITVTGALKTDIEDTDYVFDATNKTITLKNSAFPTNLTDTTSKVILSNTGTFTLKLATEGDDKVPVAGTLEATKFEWALEEVKDGETVKSVTAKIQKDVAHGWESTTTGTFTYKDPATQVYAEITNLAAATAEANLPSVSTLATASGSLELASTVLPTDEEQTVTLTNKAVDSATSSFTLALGTGANAPGTKDEMTENPIELKVTPLEGGSQETTTATVTQTLKEGWTVDTTSQTTITYSAEKEITLATIANLNKDAKKNTDIKLNDDKTITLNEGAFITTDDTHTITLTPGSGDEGYDDNDYAYTLAINDDLNQDNTKTTDKYVTANENGTATISEQMEAYYALDETDSLKATYTAPKAADEPLVTVEGLAENAVLIAFDGADVADTDTTKELDKADVVFNTSDKTITLNEGAVAAEPTKGDEIAIKESESDYSLVLGDGLKAVATDDAAPTLDFDGSAPAVVKELNAGWAAEGWDKDAPFTNNDTVSTSFIYAEPDALTLATIENLATDADETNVKIAATADGDNNYVITLSKGALNESETAPVKLTHDEDTATIKGIGKYEFSFALDTVAGGGKVDVYGSDTSAKTTPKLIVGAAPNDSEDPDYDEELEGTYTAKIVVYESAGWEVGTDKTDSLPTVTFHAEDEPVVLAKVVNLAEKAAEKNTGTDKATKPYANIAFDSAAKKITLSRDALQQETDDFTPVEAGTDYDVSVIKSETVDGYDGDMFEGYYLAVGDDVKAAGTSYELDSTTPITVSGGTAEIIGTLNQGWELDGDEEPTLLAYKAAVEDATLATITNLSTTLTAAGSDIEIADTADTNGKFVIKLSKGAFVFNDDEETEDDGADANTPVVLKNEDVGNFILALKNPDDTDTDNPTVDAIGFKKNYGWAVSGTTANYNKANKEGWTLTTTGDDANLKVVYKARVDPTDSNATDVTSLIKVTNLASDLSVDTMTSGSDTITAVGSKIDGIFVPGLWISKEPVGSNTGEITVSRNVLVEGNAPFTGTDAGNYDLVLNAPADSADNAKNLYVLQKSDFTTDGTDGGTLVNKYFWTFTESTGTAIYKKATPAYWSVDGSTVKYNAQGTATEVARVKGLSTSLETKEIDDYYNKGKKADFVGGVILASNDNSFDESKADATDSSLVKVTKLYVKDTETETTGDQTQYGKITIEKNALAQGKAELSNTTSKNQFGLVLGENITAPELDAASWAVSGTTATYSAKIKTAGYSLTDKNSTTGEYNSISYTAANNTAQDIAVITGLKSGLTANEGAITGITVEDNVITLDASALGTATTTKLTNKTNTEFSLALGTGIKDYANETDKATIDAGEDVWRLNNTTATYQHIIPAHYTTKDSVTIGYTAESSKATYATVKNLKSGLVQENDIIVATAGENTPTAALLTVADGQAADDPKVITVKKAALGTTTVTLTNGKGLDNKATSYVFALDNGVDRVAIAGTPAWTVNNGTATYTGDLTAGYGLTTNDTNIKYYAAKTGQTLATLTNLKNDAAASVIAKNSTFTDATATTGTFELAEGAFDAKAVTLTNGELSDGTKLTYTIDIDNDLTTAKTAAITGDNRWYFDSTTPTTLNYGVVHDAYYTQDADDKTKINYVAEAKDTPISYITGLASGLKIKDGAKDFKYDKSTNTDTTPVDGITLNGTKIKLAKSVLVQDATKPAELTNKVGSITFQFERDETTTIQQSGQEMLKLDGTTLTLYKGKSDGYNVTKSKITYMPAESATETNTLATVTGFKSGLSQKGLEVGTYATPGDTSSTFTPVISHTANAKTFTIKKDALNGTNAVMVADGKAGKDYKLELDSTDFTAANTPQPNQKSWVVSGTTTTYNTGTTAGWALDANSVKLAYQAADFATKTDGSNTLATVSNLKSGLTVSEEDASKIVDSNNKTAVTVADTAITLTDYALNKKDVLLKNGTGSYTLSIKTTEGDGQVTTSATTKIWAKDNTKDTTKAVYTIDTTAGYSDPNTSTAVATTVGKDAYDDYISYVSAEKKTATLTGLGSGATLSAADTDGNTLAGVTFKDTDSDGEVDTIQVAKAALPTAPTAANKDTTLKLANSKTSYKLALGSDVNSATTKTWTIKNGTATYAENYKEKSYLKKSDTEYTYAAEAKDITLATITGLNKTLATTEALSDEQFKTAYGIQATTKTQAQWEALTATESSGESGQFNEEDSAAGSTINVIELTDRTTFANGNVTLKNLNDSDYVLFANVKDVQETPGTVESGKFTAATYEKDTPLWTFNKGTLTMAIGTGDSWKYKQTKGANTATTEDDVYDYNTLQYSKATTTLVATVKGLNTTLTLKDNKLYDSTGTTQLVSLDTTGESGGTSDNPYEIKLKAGALPTTIKNNTKITLTLPKANAKTYPTVYQYTLANDGMAYATDFASTTVVNTDKLAANADRVWSIAKGTASYQYDTSAGWTFDDKTVTYTTKKTNVLAKISGVDKEWTTTVTDKDGNVTSTTVKPSDKIIGAESGDNTTYNDIIEIAGDTVLGGSSDTLETDDGDPLITFTLKNADYLANGKISISAVDKNHKYYVLADESLAVEEYDPKWTVKGTAGTATLTAGTTKGYSNAFEEGDKKYGTAINFTAEKALITYATVKGLTKDTKTTAEDDSLETLVNKGGLTFDTATQKIGITDAVLGETTVSITNGKDPDTKEAYSYTFDESIETTAPNNHTKISQSAATAAQLKATNGVVNVVRESAAGKFTLSLDGTKLEYNKTAKDTILATVKGLDKTLTKDDSGKIVKGTTEVVTLSNGIITLKDAALANANVSFTLGKGIEDGTYSVELDNDVTTDSTYANKDAWTFSNGTATYKNYDEGYYKVDNKGGYTYVKEKTYYTYATISGLKSDADVSSFTGSTSNYGGTIKITDAMLINDKDKNDNYTGKNVTLSNKKANGITANFKLALDSTLTQKSTLEAGTTFEKGKLTGTQTAGYMKASDTSITYLKTAKANQLIATLTGINTAKTVSVTGASKTTGGTITLNSDVVANKSVTLTTTDLADANKLTYTISGVGTGVNTDRGLRGEWAWKSNTATFTGFATEAYKVEESGKSVTYNKAIGTAASGTKAEKPAAVMTIKNVAESGITSGTASGITVSGNVGGKAATMSNGLIPVTFKNTNNILGSNDADTITVVDTGASIKGGKGDDKITLGSGNDIILYANGDGNDIIANFTVASDMIKITSGKVTSVTKSSEDSAVIKVGTGSITLNTTGIGNALTSINIVDNKGTTQLNPYYGSSDVLLADDNYSMDAAALSDIVEPFKASYTPYDFESGLDLVKQNSFTPAITYTGNDKK